MNKPVDWPREATVATAGNLVRVDRGDGNLLKMTPKEAGEFVAAHPGAFITATPQATSGDEAVQDAADDLAATTAVATVLQGTVSQVEFYVGSVADEGELDVLAQAELEGRARAGVAEAIARRRAELEAAAAE